MQGVESDPFNFPNYFMQRMNEFFGPDIEQIVYAPMQSADKEPQEQESPDELEEPLKLSKRQRRLLRQYFPLDIYETEAGYLVEAELPGAKKEDIEVHVDHNNVLTMNVLSHQTHHFDLQGKEPAKQEKAEKLILAERRKGKLRRNVRLPKNADWENVKSGLEDGILSLSFAKLPQSQIARRINI